ncbi:MAG: TIGR01620 family protein [Alphaproteobacteria bacterium]
MSDPKSAGKAPKPARIAIEPREKSAENSAKPKPTRLDASDAKVAMHRLEEAFGGSEHQQAEILPPKRKGWSLAAWGGLFLFLFFLLALAADAFFTLRALSAFAPWLGWAGLALLGLGLLFFSLMILREWFLARALQRHTKARSDLDAGLRAGDPAATAKGLKRMENKLRSRPDLAQAHERFELTQRSAYTDAESLTFYEQTVLQELDKRALKSIRQASFSSAWLTTISPFAILDVSISLWRSLKLLREISALYGGPQSAFSSLRLLRLIFRNLFIAGGLEAGDSLLQNILGGGIAGKISAKLSEGAINGLMTARIGLAAIKVLRPMPFVALPEPTVAQLASDLANDIKTKALGA